MKSLLFKSHACFWFMALLSFAACKKEESKKVNPPEFKEEFKRYVSAYTSGMIDRQSVVKVRFADYVIPEDKVGKVSDNDLFDFNPTVKGKTFWVDRRTVEFRPDEFFTPGKIYDCTLDLEEVYDTISSDYEKFPFQINITKQSVYIDPGTLVPVVDSKTSGYLLKGKVQTSQFEYPSKVEEVLKIMKDGKLVHPKWVHDSIGKEHLFFVDTILRTEAAYKITLQWDAKNLEANYVGSHILEIPSLKDFKVIDEKTFNEPEQYMAIQFSDPLMPNQDLQSLIRSEQSTFNFVIENNVIRAFPNSRITGDAVVVLEPGIKNIYGYKREVRDTLHLNFEDVAPNLREVSNGVILPTSEKIPFAFEAINLNAVDIRITKIYESNILEFLQSNNLDGDGYLEYVGKVIFEGKIKLDHDPGMNLTKWNRHAIDLSKFMHSEAGAIYRIHIRFRKDYSLYQCPEEEEGSGSGESEESEVKPSLWDYYSSYYYYEENEEPCRDYYYRYQPGVHTNLLASDIGLIAKAGTDGSYFVAASDLKTNNPLSGVTIEFFDKQKQVITSSQTDVNGFAKFKIKDEPVVIIAKSGKQRGYLKLNNNLSLSRFEISGNTYEKGLKGFIYAERGVWRPGDSMFVNFILEDKMRALPIDHPVVFELYNPRGQMVEKIIKKDGAGGFYTFIPHTDLGAPTGTYLAKVKVGGSTFEKRLKVETIIPNRLKINLDMVKEKFSSKDEKIGDLKVKWLHGAPAADMKADINVTFRKSGDPFPKYKEFNFNDPVYKSVPESELVFDGKVNAEGVAEIKNTIHSVKGVSGVLNTTFYCKVFEPGGNFSSDNFSATYSPYKEYVGIKFPKGRAEDEEGFLMTNKNHVFEIVTVDENGNPIDKELTVQMYKMEYSWWYDFHDEDMSSYNGREHKNFIREDKVITKNGAGSWTMFIEEEKWGNYFVRVCMKDGHCTGAIVHLDYPDWYARQNNNTEGTTMLTLSANKDKYIAGEKAVINIPSTFKGKALVTLEKGGKVLKGEWIEAQNGKTNYTFNVTGDMAPNVYAYVTLLQPNAQTSNDLPVRMYGVMPLKVDNPASHLEPVITMPEVLRPEQKLNITIKEKEGKKMSYTIAMVDEGLLDLTKFKTPDPWPEFYGKEALEVSTWDLYDYVIKNKNGNLKKLLSIGGDDGGLNGEGAKVQRFKPMVKFLGPYFLEAGKTATHSIVMPNYIGSVRTMVIAANDGAYGSSEVTCAVKKPLMILATLPRVLSPGEEVNLPVTVFAEEGVKDVNVEIKINGLLKTSETLTKKIRFGKAGEQVINFPLKVSEEIGVAKVQVFATSGKEKAWNETELTVRAPNPYMTKSNDGIINPGKSSIFNYEAFGIKGTNKGSIEISSLPPVNLDSRLDYLLQYPHGCVEQTTSSVFPQIALGDVIDLSSSKKQEIEKNIKAGIKRLRLFQTSEGGMSYWPGRYEEETEWGTNYAGHFLIEASARGYNVPKDMMDKWKEFQRKKANLYSKMTNDYSDIIQAYRIYLLALMKSPEFGAMNRMKEDKQISNMSKWYLAGAYYISGQKNIALEISKNLSTDVEVYKDFAYTYGSDVRDEAVILDILSQMNRRQEAEKMLNIVCKRLKSDMWMSTQETAYSLIGVSRFAGNTYAPMLVRYRVNETEWKTVEGTKRIIQIPLDLKNSPKGKFEIQNSGQTLAYTNLIMKGIPLQGNEQAYQSDVSVHVAYKNRKGEVISVDEIEQGTDLVAEIKVVNGSKIDLDEMALTFMVPSGWEIHNPRMNGDQFGLVASTAEYMDVKDDRVYYYFDMNRYDYKDNEKENGYVQTYRVALNASYVGKFYLPSVYVEAMYDKKISSATAGKWIKVVPGKFKSL